MNKDLQYFVNNQQVPFEQLQSVLSVEASKDKEAFVVLRCDKTLAVQQLVNVLEIGNKLNVKMILATQKE